MRKYKFFTIFLPIIFVAITGINFIWHVYGYRNDIFAKFNATYWTYRFMHSQWSPTATCLVTDPHVNPHTCIWDDNWYAKHPKILPEYQKISIGDDGLYAYVGYAYMQGKNPTLLNAELPPLGKYLVGLFEIVTGTMGAFSLFFTGLSIILVFVFSKTIFRSNLLASVSMMVFSFEPLLIEQMRAPYLDTLYLCTFLLTALFFLKHKYLLSGLTLGLFMSIKPPFFSLVVLVVYGLCLFIQKKFLLKPLITIILAACIVYISTYARTFLLGHSLGAFVQAQKYMLHFYSTGAKGVLGAVVPMVLQGRWPTWFGPIQKVSEWTIFWPLGAIGTSVSMVLFVRSKNNKSDGVWFQIIWICGYIIFLVFTPIFPRYLLLLLPFMYNLSIWALLKGIGLKYAWLLPSAPST